jgi:hypothetical protein
VNAVTQSALAEAFDRIEDFLAVQGRRPAKKAVDLLQASVGIDEEVRATLAERLAGLGEPCEVGQVLFGVIVGLLCEQLEAERRS